MLKIMFFHDDRQLMTAHSKEDDNIVPFPGDENCPGCVLYSFAEQLCQAANAEECAQVNGLLDG